MVPGRQINIGYITRAFKRRLWWIVVPFVLIAAGGAVVAKLLPNKYQSQTAILVVPQRVPETYVKSTVTGPITDRLRSMNEQIQSRTRLERIILEFNLYPEQRKTHVMEDVVDLMRGSIGLQIGKDQGFVLSFVYSDPVTAAKVTDRLASLFIDENLRDREVQAENTSQFLEAQLEEARRRLLEHENKLKAYRERYAGQLPSQLQSNLQVIQTTQLQIQSLEDATNRYRDQRLTVERQIADSENAPAPIVVAPPQQGGAAAAGALADPTSVGSGTPAQQLEVATRNLRSLEARGLTDEHPDLIRLKRTIKDLEARVAADAAKAVKPTAAMTQSEINARNRVEAMKNQLAGIDRQIAANEQDVQKLKAKLSDYQSRIEAVPGRESELTELTRDYSTLQNSYQALLAKREDSQIAANLERRQVGEQFKVLDAARVPEKPLSPNRLLICGGAVFAGLIFGLALAGVREVADSSVRSEEDIVHAIDLPVLAFVPLVVTAIDRTRQRRRKVWASVFAALVVVAGAAVVLWKMRFLS